MQQFVGLVGLSRLSEHQCQNQGFHGVFCAVQKDSLAILFSDSDRTSIELS